MKVAPVSAEMITDEAPMSEATRDAAPVPAPATTVVPKTAPATRAKRAELP
jgi:hypothetical protein